MNIFQKVNTILSETVKKFKTFLNGINEKINIDTGQTPIFTSIIVSFIIIASIILLCTALGPAKHIIMGDFAYADPTSTTTIIMLYSLLVSAIFLNEENNFKLKSNQQEVPFILRFFQFIVSVLPLLVWLLVMLWNDPVSKWASLIITVISIISVMRFFTDEIPKTGKTEELMKLLMALVGFVLLYNVFLYLFEFDFLDNNYRAQSAALFRKISGIGGALLLFYFLIQLPEYLKEKKGVLFIGLFVSTLLFSMKGAINTLDVLLVFGIFMRVVLFGAGYILRLSSNLWKIVRCLINKEKIPYKEIRFSDLLLVAPFFIFLLIMFSNKNHSIHDITTHKANRSQLYMEDYITQWIKNRSDNNEPIVLVSGQGGGSRAGCAFYSAMSILDTIPKIKNNVLAMTTISGSSNGAGFYLTSKKMAPDSLHSDLVLNKLYTQDYISILLFRLLLWDPLISILPSKVVKMFNWTGRNKFLPKLESKAARDAFNIPEENKVLSESSWQEIYNKMPDNTNNELPLFIPATYNITQAQRALCMPFPFKNKTSNAFYSVLDSISPNKSITIGESILLSQSFPVVNANGIIDGKSVYIDGGVYDNFGFETLLDLYDVVSKIRNEVAPKKSLVLITILNSKISDENPTIKYGDNVTNTLTAVTNSVFVSSPNKSLKVLEKKINENGDHFKMLEIYSKITSKDTMVKVHNWFKYAPDSGSIMMSRYLHWKEIDALKKMASHEIREKIVKGDFIKLKHTLYFDFGKSKPDKEAIELLKNIQTDCIEKSIDIVGYSDNRGNAKNNLKLSKARAKEIKNYMTRNMGVKPDRISISAGEHQNFREGIFDRIYDRRCIITIDTL